MAQMQQVDASACCGWHKKRALKRLPALYLLVRRPPRGAACGPLPADRCVAHSHTSSVTHASELVRVDDHMLDPALHELAVDRGELHDVWAGTPTTERIRIASAVKLCGDEDRRRNPREDADDPPLGFRVGAPGHDDA